tara:strand:+ start:1806 stop:2237 length:432 start_codon:yes stop_codon:yes gene_type:complete
MVNYKDGKIYKIVDNTNGNIYIGSTAEKRLCRRLQKHKAYYKSYFMGQSKTKTACFKIIDNGDYRIELIETFPCDNIDELHKREQYWLDNIDCININRATTNPDIKKCSNENNKKWRAYCKSWGGDLRADNCNLLKINPFLFQ